MAPYKLIATNFGSGVEPSILSPTCRTSESVLFCHRCNYPGGCSGDRFWKSKGIQTKTPLAPVKFNMFNSKFTPDKNYRNPQGKWLVFQPLDFHGTFVCFRKKKHIFDNNKLLGKSPHGALSCCPSRHHPDFGSALQRVGSVFGVRHL